jgi:hypothetical protein
LSKKIRSKNNKFLDQEKEGVIKLIELDIDKP